MQPTYNLPRVELPTLTEDDKAQIEAVQEEMDWYQRTSLGFLRALFLKGKPFTGKAKPKRKPTKHQRRIASARVRSGYLAQRAAADS